MMIYITVIYEPWITFREELIKCVEIISTPEKLWLLENLFIYQILK